MGEVLKKIPLLENWIRDLRDAVRRSIENGTPVPGFKLVPKRSVRKWISRDDVVAWAMRHGHEYELYTEPQLKSPAQVEKFVGKKNVPKELIESVSNGTTLALESDVRGAAKITLASDEFEADL